MQMDTGTGCPGISGHILDVLTVVCHSKTTYFLSLAINQLQTDVTSLIKLMTKYCICEEMST